MDQEFENIDSSGQWQNLYNEIRNHSQECSCKVAKFPENRIRNRYRDVSPYDHSRVRLEDSENDYINASLITMEEAQRRYILTQGPLKSTCGHFWQMVWEQRSSAVIMLNRLLEKGSEKCAQYWPSEDERDVTLTDSGFVVTLLSETVDTNYVIRVLELRQTKTGDVRQIHHFHYTAWPDFGVPESPASFLNFLFNVRKTGSLSPEHGPAVVHCSAGIGRSGTFSLVDTCLVLMEKSPFSVDIQKILLCMREYRMGLIQTPDQLRFSYLAVKEGAKIVLGEINQQRLITSIPSSDRRHGQSHSGSEPLDVERHKIQSELKAGKENTSRSSLRKRSSDQKVVSVAQKVQHMKLKLRDSEKRKERWQFWRGVLLNVGAGAAVALGLGVCWALLCQ